MNEINLLITSAGRRVELVQCFQEAKRELNFAGKIVAADASPIAPALFFADEKYQVCRIDNENYVDEIVQICRDNHINGIIPTLDTELLKLAENKEKIEMESGARVVISDAEIIKIFRNKYNTADFFLNNGFHAPKYYDLKNIPYETLHYPLFIKPLDGSSSVNTFKITNEEELRFFSNYVPHALVTDYVQGDEYTVDILCDFDGNCISIVPRKRLVVRAGEIQKGVVEKNRRIIEVTKRVLEILKPVGPITLQCIVNESGVYLIEINPRFGGGAPMSIKAGANSPKDIYRLFQGEKLDYQEEYLEGLIGIRFDQAIYVREDGELFHD
jgi:carbamoyl-phosphate synthase large subunit